MQKQLGVLIHGAGWVSGEHIKAFQHNPHTHVAAICSRTMESVKKRAAEAGLKDIGMYTDLDEALRHPGVDIVSVCTPQRLHADNTIRAARAGKHVVIEKPIANSVDEMHAMLDAVRKAGVKTVVSFVLRWNPLFETLKAMIADDAFGQVYYVETDYEHDIAGWWSGFEDVRKKSTGISALNVGGCHAIDAARWFAGRGRYQPAKITEVFAYCGGYRKGLTREFDYLTGTWVENVPPMEYDGLEVVLVKFDTGAIGKVSVNFDCVMPYTFPIQIFGDKGSVRDNRVWSHKFPGQKDWVEIPTILPVSADVTHHPFQGQMNHFVDCILNDRESHCNLEDSINTHEVVFAAQQCYETRQPVRLPLR
ncbi:MAG TPA: Gfo/Idh/MocA family oxidoreductase [bacterium]|nr:Gfo/Idh/MocA family oxidoreductase [bacterium]HQL62903.1 Gfo/Idh/MocA family oxidoreductase [bacterium]